MKLGFRGIQKNHEKKFKGYPMRLVLIFICLFFFSSCEDTNLLIMADAGVDAVSAITLSDEQVKDIARQAARASDEKHRVASSGNKYEERLRGLVKNIQTIDGYDFDIKVYLTRNVNAFAMADGTVRIYSGLMDLMNDEELLFVIGHEMGHVVKNHSRKKVVVAYASSAIRKGLASQENEIGQMARSVLGGLVERLANAQFSQHEEREADDFGAQFLLDNGYEVNGAVTALRKLEQLANNHTVLSSHPDPADRAKRLETGEDPAADEESGMLSSLIGIIKNIILLILSLVKGILA